MLNAMSSDEVRPTGVAGGGPVGAAGTSAGALADSFFWFIDLAHLRSDVSTVMKGKYLLYMMTIHAELTFPYLWLSSWHPSFWRWGPQLLCFCRLPCLWMAPCWQMKRPQDSRRRRIRGRAGRRGVPSSSTGNCWSSS